MRPRLRPARAAGEIDLTWSLTASMRTLDTAAKLKRALLRPRERSTRTLGEGGGDLEVRCSGVVGSSSGTSSILGWRDNEASRIEEMLEVDEAFSGDWLDLLRG